MTKQNLDYFFYMRNYNLKQMETATTAEDKEYYRTSANHWTEKINKVSPELPFTTI